MNCQLCQKESDAYREGRLSNDMRTQVEVHLKNCEICKKSFRLQILTDRIIDHEKKLIPDDYLTSRIMVRIERLDEQVIETDSLFTRLLRPVIISTSMAAAIFVGILIGNIYKPSISSMSKPVELALIDDITIESINNLSSE
jgi:hypothetical protein